MSRSVKPSIPENYRIAFGSCFSDPREDDKTKDKFRDLIKTFLDTKKKNGKKFFEHVLLYLTESKDNERTNAFRLFITFLGDNRDVYALGVMIQCAQENNLDRYYLTELQGQLSLCEFAMPAASGYVELPGDSPVTTPTAGTQERRSCLVM